MYVLQTRHQIETARKELIKRGVSALESPLTSQFRKWRLLGTIAIGDWLKSWDVLTSLNFLETHVPKDMPILDIGCYASELIVALHKSGFTNLTGADLNPQLKKMPYQQAIHYEQTDFMRTPFENASFQVVTSISVIEHGFDSTALLKEMSRLLKPDGFFIASFDYWQDKIDTTGVKFFDMDWLIFSKADIEDFVQKAADYDLTPVGEMNYSGNEKPIDCAGKQYTFGWLVLQKTA
jgi:SAM-dependent methyltransferase